jgi:hypothetical protein
VLDFLVVASDCHLSFFWFLENTYDVFFDFEAYRESLSVEFFRKVINFSEFALFSGGFYFFDEVGFELGFEFALLGVLGFCILGLVLVFGCGFWLCYVFCPVFSFCEVYCFFDHVLLRFALF